MPIDLPFSGQFDTDADILSLKNTLQDGQSDNDTSRVSAVTGDGGIVHGVHGINDSGNGYTPDVGAGIWGESDNGYGVVGTSIGADGVRGFSGRGYGVHGIAPGTGSGVWGEHEGGGYGVKGTSVQGPGVYGESFGGGPDWIHICT